MNEHTIEQMLVRIDQKLDGRLDELEQRVARLERSSKNHGETIATLTDILDRLVRDDSAVLARKRDEVRIDRRAAYRAFEQEGIPRRTALRSLADRGRIRIQTEAPGKRRFTPKVRVGQELVRCVVAIIGEVSP